MSDPQHEDMLAAWAEPRHGANQCEHGQLARVCVICEQGVEIERLITTINHAREYHAKELADATDTAANLRAERDNARADVNALRAQVAGLRESIAESLRLLGTDPKSARAVLLDAARKGAA